MISAHIRNIKLQYLKVKGKIILVNWLLCYRFFERYFSYIGRKCRELSRLRPSSFNKIKKTTKLLYTNDVCRVFLAPGTLI